MILGGDIFSWWESIRWDLQWFYGIAILSSFSITIQALLVLFGVGVEEDVLDTDASHDSGLGILSFKSITAFFLGFGWTGVLALKSGLPVLAALGLAATVGAALMYVVYAVMRAIFGLRSDGTLRAKNAIGAVGTVYVSIPPSGQTGGQIQVTFQSQFTTINAITRGASEIRSQQRVKVVDVVDEGTLVVEPFDGALAPESKSAI